LKKTIRLVNVNGKLEQMIFMETSQPELMYGSKKVLMQKEPELEEQPISYFKKSALKLEF